MCVYIYIYNIKWVKIIARKRYKKKSCKQVLEIARYIAWVLGQRNILADNFGIFA